MNDIEEQTPDRWTTATIYPDMWVNPDDDPREGGQSLGDERTTLMEYVRTQRLTLEMKCADLGAEGMATRSVPPSTMSLLGLVRHMAGVEQAWFRLILAGQDVPRLWRTPDDRDADWNGAVPDPTVVAEAWRAWREECAFTNDFVAGAADLSVTDAKRAISLREALLHLIEEYARHNGHADLIRERVDGRVGQ